ncbi:lysophospholipid acyltransferase 5-like [Plodia interpunctella]|uniref:lysophospholipid acyltransferase 5-like n=1 Tax=Plodia interpunctella TaxID=58824 RepID=UPI0023680FBC|nr:lysophospholipid acyltransferase 5-like [Plodia interpunctella]XP_053624464.1 lysophospholipid acyltransferase 5-like [Plodia interpunctella]
MIGILLNVLEWIGLSPLPYIAGLIGSTEPALKLLLSILLAYPYAWMYHKYYWHSDRKSVRNNLYFIVVGLDLAFYNFGISLYHNIIPVVVLYLTTQISEDGKINAIITFVFNLTYLIVGYIVTESEDYDITWTMPHCVLTLKLIALSFDLWDGQLLLKREKLSANAQETALVTPPTFMELLGFVYFPACFLVGPIFSFQRYKKYIEGKFPLESEADECQKQGMIKLIQGALYLVAFQIGGSVFSMKYMLSDEFSENSFFYKHMYCGLWAHFALYKYIACWLLTEAACIRFGLSYNGMEIPAGGLLPISKWDGCNNIKLLRFEGVTKFQHYIDTFNCNTNHFAAEYIYKRLKFLGDRNLSQLLTLLFLAIWHGIRSGYYVTFFNEFIIIYMEKELESILKKTIIYEKMWSNVFIKYLMYIFLKMYTIIFMGWSLVPFDVKVYSKWLNVYSSLYFSGFLLFLPWAFVYKPLLIKAIHYYRIKREAAEKID